MFFFHVLRKVAKHDPEGLQAFKPGQGLQCIFLDDYELKYDFLYIWHVGYSLGVHRQKLL